MSHRNRCATVSQDNKRLFPKTAGGWSSGCAPRSPQLPGPRCGWIWRHRLDDDHRGFASGLSLGTRPFPHHLPGMTHLALPLRPIRFRSVSRTTEGTGDETRQICRRPDHRDLENCVKPVFPGLIPAMSTAPGIQPWISRRPRAGACLGRQSATAERRAARPRCRHR